MTQDEYDELIRRMARVMERMDGFIDEQREMNDGTAARLDEQQEVNKNLQAMITRHDARLDEQQQTFRNLNATLTKLDTTMDNIMGYIQGQGRHGQN